MNLSRSQVFLILDKLMEDHGDDVRVWLESGGVSDYQAVAATS